MLFWAFMVVVVVAIVLVVVGRSGNDPESVMARLPVRERQRLAREFAQIERDEDLEPDPPGSPWGSLIDRSPDGRLRARWVFSAPEACSRVRVGGHYRCEHVEVRVAEIESTGERDDKGWYLVVAVVEPVCRVHLGEEPEVGGGWGGRRSTQAEPMTRTPWCSTARPRVRTG